MNSKLKVLIVNKFLYPNGGSETYIFEIGKELVRQGHHVQYFGMEHEKRIVGNRAESYTSNMDFHTGKLAKLLYPFKIIYSVEAQKKIRQVLEDFSPDVVHLNNFNFQLTPSILYEIRRYEKKCGHKIKIVFTAHDYQLVCPNHLLMKPDRTLCMECLGRHPWNCLKHRCVHGSAIKSLLGSIEGWMYQKLHAYRMIDTVICPSQFIKERLISNPDLQGKMIVMHNFVDRIENISLRKEDYVLYFGRYCEEKGTHLLVEVCKSLPEIPFVFAGSGPLNGQVDGVSNIENRGFLSGQELAETISRARFCVFPSQWYENCPFAVMEAQMYKTPVLASDFGGTPELIQNGITGELFSGSSSKELEEKIKMLWNDKALVQQYAENCSKLPFVSVETYCSRLEEVYR